MSFKHNSLIVVGDIVYSSTLNEIYCRNGYIQIEDGRILEFGSMKAFNERKKSFIQLNNKIKYLSPSQFLIPGFVDCHTHAPQFPNIGLGLDRPLLEWLDKYTFPLEGKYSNKEFATIVYDQVVKRLIKNGTTTACYFGTLHLEGTMELVKSVVKHRQRAFVGKVSMNIQNDAGYYNTTDNELKDVEIFVKKVFNYENRLVQPAITPRFAVSCDRKLMKGLSEIAHKNTCLIQSHISENQKEIDYVLSNNKDCANYSDVYDKCNIFNNKCIMAHAVHLSEHEMEMFVQKGTSIAHCPASNTRLKSGLCPVRKLLDHNIKLGLGTDVSGGDNASVLDAMRRAMDVSQHVSMSGGEGPALNFKEAFYLGTLGGATALFLNDRIGTFEVNYDFDALVIDINAKDSPIDDYQHSIAQGYAAILEKVQKFIYCGDDRNIVEVYVNGIEIKNNL